MKLSIIVPVYNAEAYIRKCIESIQKQTFKDFELLLIDDGSNDASGRICDAYAQADGRIKVIHQVNKGVSSARNAGLEACRGEYFTFIDSDDWVDECIYERLFNDINEYRADIACCNVWEDNKLSFAVSKLRPTVKLCNKEAMKHLLRGKVIRGVLWNKLYSSKLLQGLRFNTDIFLAEDALFNVEIFSRAQTITYNENKMYHYVHRKDSASHGEFNSKKLSEISAREKIRRIIKNRYPDLEELAFSRYIETIVMLGAQMAVAKENNRVLFESNQKFLVRNKKRIFTSSLLRKRFKKHAFLQLHSFTFCRKLYQVTAKGRDLELFFRKKAARLLSSY